MDIQTFIDNYQETFSGKAELPIAFWYSDTLSGELRKTQGCLFKALPAIRNGEIISMSGESIGCGGGKFYTGFTPMPEHVPNFVSLKERDRCTKGDQAIYPFCENRPAYFLRGCGRAFVPRYPGYPVRLGHVGVFRQ